MTVMHITNDYSGSTVYKNLIGRLDEAGCRQIVYSPIKEKKRFGKNRITLNVNGSKIIYSKILNKHTDRILYRQKIAKIVSDLEKRIDLSKIDLIHAHTWYSDGGAAYILSEKYSIPYIVTIRNSDLNIFHKYLIHERGFGNTILDGAKYVVLISASYKERVLSLPSFRKLRARIGKRLVIIPNGVDPYWIENKAPNRKSPSFIEDGVVNVLYIGKFNKGKNVANLIAAIKKLNESSLRYYLTLVGGGGDDEKRILTLVENTTFVRYLGAEYDYDRLKIIFRNSDVFAMPSRAETFGLVYIEALLQGIPVVYTKGEGIDGFYDNSIGEKVGSSSPVEIARKINKLISEYDRYNFDIDQIAQNHDWRLIADEYLRLYRE